MEEVVVALRRRLLEQREQVADGGGRDELAAGGSQVGAGEQGVVGGQRRIGVLRAGAALQHGGGERVDGAGGQQRAPGRERAGGRVGGEQRAADDDVAAAAREVGHARVRLQRPGIGGDALEQLAVGALVAEEQDVGRGLLQPGDDERERTGDGPVARSEQPDVLAPRRGDGGGDLGGVSGRRREVSGGHEADAQHPPAVRGLRGHAL